jgi:hypothetical protein
LISAMHGDEDETESNPQQMAAAASPPRPPSCNELAATARLLDRAIAKLNFRLRTGERTRVREHYLQRERIYCGDGSCELTGVVCSGCVQPCAEFREPHSWG